MGDSVTSSRIWQPHRRDALRLMAGGVLGCAVDAGRVAFAVEPPRPLTIIGLNIAPIAYPPTVACRQRLPSVPTSAQIPFPKNADYIAKYGGSGSAYQQARPWRWARRFTARTISGAA